ncbi:hypothetical protein EG329_004184 [Mollisiaceae sp. DMI_Dod_QoI]|nr:hypothetical protein EG329_004184 [Helotiales sp. DMI_Dod_QoI]
MGNRNSKISSRHDWEDWSPSSNPFSFFFAPNRPWSIRPTSQRAVVGLIPDLGTSAKWIQKECDCYWDYDSLESSLVDALMTLPVEIRQRIYYFVALSWSPLDPYPDTRPNHTVVGLARRNQFPMYANPDLLIESVLDVDRPDLVMIPVPRRAPRWGFLQALMGPGPQRPQHFSVMQVNSAWENREASLFREKYGMLDYLKESEYHNLREFVKALERLERTKIKSAIANGSKFESSGVLNDFMAWFWDTIVINLNKSWCTKDPASLANMHCGEYLSIYNSNTWLKLRPQYHNLIKHITLDFSLEMTVREGDLMIFPGFYLHITDRAPFIIVFYELEASCAYLTATLPNLKSITMFCNLKPEEFHRLMENTDHECVKAIRLLRASEKMEVFMGLDGMVTERQRDNERSVEAVWNEQALELLLMPDEMLIKMYTNEVVQQLMLVEHATFDFESEASIGWMTMEDTKGRLSYSAANFSWVLTSTPTFRHQRPPNSSTSTTLQNKNNSHDKMSNSGTSKNSSGMRPSAGPEDEANSQPSVATPAPASIIPGTIPYLAQYCQQRDYSEKDIYWDYSHTEFSSTLIDNLDTSLITHLKSLPKELRHKIYGYVTLTWSPFNPYPTSKQESYSLVNLARRNAAPLYTDPEEERRWISARQLSENTDEIFSCRISLLVSQQIHSPVLEYFIRDSLFSEKCGLLDYYKISEYHNLLEFAKTLQRHEERIMERDKKKVNLVEEPYHPGSHDGEVAINMVADFEAWFWDIIVLDLRLDWYSETARPSHEPARKPTQYFFSRPFGTTDLVSIEQPKQASPKWLNIHHKYHEHIQHISLNLEIKDYPMVPLSPTKEIDTQLTASIFKTTIDFSTPLVNLRSILLFITLTDAALKDILMQQPKKGWVSAFRLIKPRDRFEVRVGVPITCAKKDYVERDTKHLSNEKCLERLLMPTSIFEKEELELERCTVKADQADLECETEASLGWMTLEGKGGELMHESGGFLLVADSIAT